MAKPDLDFLCRQYRAFRTAGYCMPAAWQLANRSLRNTKAKQ